MTKQLNEISAKLTASYLSKAKAEREGHWKDADARSKKIDNILDLQNKRIYKDKVPSNSKEIVDLDNEKTGHANARYDSRNKALKRIWNIQTAERKLKNKFQAGNNPPPPEANKPAAQTADNSFGGKIRKVAQAAKSGLSSLKKRVFGEEYYENLDYRNSVIPLLDSLLEGKSNDIEKAFNEAIAARIENAMVKARKCVAEEVALNELSVKTMSDYTAKAKDQKDLASSLGGSGSLSKPFNKISQMRSKGIDTAERKLKSKGVTLAPQKNLTDRENDTASNHERKTAASKALFKSLANKGKKVDENLDLNEAGFVDASNMSPRQIQKMGHNDNNDAPSRPSRPRPAPAKSSSGAKLVRKVNYPADYDETADGEHLVHINGKPWKSFGTKAHATNVAKKIKGATVHPTAGKAV